MLGDRSPSCGVLPVGRRAAVATADALLGVCGDAAPAAVRRAWKAGISDVTRYDVTRAGRASMLSRFAGADPDSMDVPITMPPRLDGAVPHDASDGVRQSGGSDRGLEEC